MNAPKPYEYVYSATLPIDSPTYTIRKADTELYEGLKAGKFCYVFNSRKTGKSSLRVQTMRRLQNDGMACAEIDLSAEGSNGVTQEQWYADIIDTLVQKFNLNFDFESWWEEQELLSSVKRFSKFIETVFLVQLLQNNPERNIVIFIDEIDSVLSLNFSSDNFFALIRACYNKRADNPIYNQLTFCLLGTITPSDLIADKQRTPFNIGEAIELTGFTLEEAKPSLAPGLAHKIDNPEVVLAEVLKWTGGQPFLTQKLCNLLVKSPTSPPANGEVQWVEEIVKTRIITNWESQDVPEHLVTIVNRILHSKQHRSRLLGIYQQILCSTSVTSGEEATDRVVVDNSPEQVDLRLSGLVVKDNATLKVYNRIYESVFNWNWVEKKLAELRPYADALSAWVDSNSQDESRLLRGQALQVAQAWAKDKRLSDQDYQFLAASQDLNKRQIEQANEILAAAQRRAEVALEEEKKANQRLVEAQRKTEVTLEKEKKANQRLVEAERKTRQQIRIGSTVLVLSIIVAIAAASFAVRANHDAASATSDKNAAVEKRQQAEKQTQMAREQLESQSANLKNVNKELTQKEKDLGQIRQQFQDATKRVKSAEKDVKIATEKQQQAQLKVEQAQKDLEQTKSDRNIALKEKQQAQHELQQAQSNLKQTERERKIVLRRLKQTQQQFQKAQSDLQQAKIARETALEATKLEQVGTNAFRELAEGRQINGLLLAMQASRGLQHLLKKGDSLAEYPAYSPLFSLLSILFNIREQNSLEGHFLPVTSVSISPDGKIIASGSGDRSIKLWKRDGTLITTLGSSYIVFSLSFSPDGKTLVSGGEQGQITLWSLPKGEEITTLPGHNDLVSSVSLSLDGRLIASSSADKTIKLWKRDGTLIKTLNEDSDNISLSADGNTLASVSNKIIKLWKRDGTLITTLNGHSDVVTMVRFSPDGQLIASASADKTIKLWKRDGTLISSLTGDEKVVDVSFSPDGQLIVSASADKTIKLWKRDGTLIKSVSGLDFDNKIVGLSPDGTIVAASSFENTIKLWKFDDTAITTLGGHDGTVSSVSFSPNSQILVSVSNKIIKLWKRDGTLIKTLTGHNESVNSVSFSPDGQLIASSSTDKAIKLWKRDGTLIKTLTGHNEGVNSVSFSPNGQLIASSSADKTIKLWKRDGTLIATFVGESFSFSPNGQTLASGNDDGSIKLWKLDGTLIKTLTRHDYGVNSVSFSPSGQTLVSASGNGTIKIWNQDGTLLKALTDVGEGIYNIKFSPNGKAFVSTSVDGTIKLWKRDGILIKTLIPIINISGYRTYDVENVTFSPDGQTLASVSNKTIKLWKVDDGTLITTLIGHNDWVTSVNFSPDGKTLASTSSDGTVILWNLDLDDLLAGACKWLQNYLRSHPEAPKICPDIKMRSVVKETEQHEKKEPLASMEAWPHPSISFPLPPLFGNVRETKRQLPPVIDMLPPATFGFFDTPKYPIIKVPPLFENGRETEQQLVPLMDMLPPATFGIFDTPKYPIIKVPPLFENESKPNGQPHH